MDPFSSIQKLFRDCFTPQERYKKIIELGKELPPMSEKLKVKENRVKGCQSTLYLYSEMHNKKIYFTAYSDALISAGLIALLIEAYNGKPPEILLKYKPTFLDELQIMQSLSPSRSNGLASAYLRMQQDALKYLISL